MCLGCHEAVQGGREDSRCIADKHEHCRLARGETGRAIMKQLKGTPKNIPIFESPCKSFKDGPRFLWQYAVDYSPRFRCACSFTVALPCSSLTPCPLRLAVWMTEKAD